MLEQQLLVGKTYRFTFKPEFERHGVCNSGATCIHKGGGVFTVRQITTFEDLALAQNGRIYETFFEPLGFTKGEMNKYFSGKPDTEYEPEKVVRKVESNRTIVTSTVSGSTVFKTVATSREELVETGRSIAKKRFNDSLNFGNYPIYKLEDVVDRSDVVYVPELAIANVPEVGIKEYRNISVAIDIGYWDKPEQMDCILTRIRQDLLLYGIPPLDINLVAVDSKWMNKNEYDALSKIRVPGKPVVITDDNRVEYIGKTAIVGGTTKTIVNPAPGTEVNIATEIDINSIIKRKVSIDHGLLITSAMKSVEGEDGKPVYIDCVYEDGIQYLADHGDGTYKYLTEGVDYTLGNPIEGFVASTSGKFIDLGPRYRVAGVSDEGRTDLLYRADEYTDAKGGVFESGKKYFKLVNGSYALITGWTAGDTVPEGIYIHNSYSYLKATDEIIAAGNVVLYVLESQHQYVESSATGVTKYAKTNVVRLDYAKAADLVGKQFAYTPSNGGALTKTELSAEDIVLFANISGQRVNIANAIAANRYAGMWFVYQGDTVEDTLATRITTESYKTLAGKPGVICGISGEVSVETFIEDGSLINERNYYQKYLATKRLYDEEVEKNALLLEGMKTLGGSKS
jgi:hypothetical protein